MATNRLYILLISLGITGIVMLWDSSEKILTPPRDNSVNEEQFPYAVASDAASRHFNTLGQLDYTFTATKLEHYRTEASDDGSIEEYTLIKSPHFIIFEKQDPWHIESKNGKLVRVNEQITLWDDVRIWQIDPIAQSQTPQQPSSRAENDNAKLTNQALSSTLSFARSELRTNRLDINPIEKVASTEEPVKISSPYGVITAVGMTADFKQRKIQLHTRVRATHKIPAKAQ